MISNPTPSLTQKEPGSKPDRVQVLRSRPDLDHPEFYTLQHLGYSGTPPGSPELTVAVFIHQLHSQHELGTRFANPCALVTASGLCPEFLSAARREQRRWWTWLNQALFSSSRVKRTIKNLDPLTRQLFFTGVLIIDGKHIRPDAWPRAPQSNLEAHLVGQVFGRLTVKSELPGGFCHCQCHCGKTADVHRKHLRSGGTRSCGCLRAEYDQQLQDKKLTKAWLQS